MHCSSVQCNDIVLEWVMCIRFLSREWHKRELGSDIGLGGEVANIDTLREDYYSMAALDTM